MSELCDKVLESVELCDHFGSTVQSLGPYGAEWCRRILTVEVTTGIV